MDARNTVDEPARGWLRHMWDKATTPDDWSSSGEPHPWWDRESTPPMCAFPRFDLFEPAYALAILSDVTPAWREVYARIADGLVSRHTTFWAAIDWLTLIGPDPRRDSYPPEWQYLIPADLRGRYEICGWTANGVEPWGLQPDPIGADGNLFFRGFFNLLLGLYRHIAGDDKWDRPFPVAGYLEREFLWSHSSISDFLSLQMAERPQGPHCENTKVYPHCVSGAGLSLQLYNVLAGGDNDGGSYQQWLEYAKAHYMATERGELAWWATYYDPLREVVHTMPGTGSALMMLEAAPYMYPADRDLVESLYEMAMRGLGWSDPKQPVVRLLADPRPVARALFLAREFGDDVTEQRLRQVVERDFEPRTFGPDNDRFGYWFGLGGQWPRGQHYAALMMSQVGEPGAWWRIFNDPDVAKHRQPTVEGVDYPDLGIAQAYNDAASEILWVTTYAGTPTGRGRPTRWRVVRLADPTSVSVTCDGQDFTGFRVAGEDSIEITSDIGEHTFRISVGARGRSPSPALAGRASVRPRGGRAGRSPSPGAPRGHSTSPFVQRPGRCVLRTVAARPSAPRASCASRTYQGRSGRQPRSRRGRARQR